MINIWFMAAKVVLVLTESSLLHCSIFPVDPSQRNTVRTWIFFIYFFARTACVRHILHKVSLKSISFLSIRSFNKIIVFEHSQKISPLVVSLCLNTCKLLTFQQKGHFFFSDFLLWEFWKVQAQFPYWERIQMWWFWRYIWTMDESNKLHLLSLLKQAIFCVLRQLSSP